MGCKVVQLSEIADLIPGFAFKSREFKEANSKAIKIGDIAPEIDERSLPSVDTSSYSDKRLLKHLCHPGDYLVAMTGNTIGKVGRMVAGVAYVNQRVLKVAPKKDKVDPGYLWAIISSKSFYDHIISHIDSHSAQPNISAKSIGEYEICMPPFAIQKAVSSVIMSIENIITINNQINGYLAA